MATFGKRKPLCMEDIFIEKPVAMHIPPSILNHTPFKGWHRHVILRVLAASSTARGVSARGDEP